MPATRQLFFQVHPLNRFQVLCRILDAPDRDRVAVFRRTKRGVDRTIKGLVEEGYKAGALHGDMPQVTREKVMRAFRKGKLDVLVCTDVASRGLDIAGLSHVINYDTPEDDRAYVHRIGRTGRAGAAGVAVTFVAWNELDTADLIRRRLELTDEPEVYSTSPLLSELFDLPTVEEAAATRRGRARKAETAEPASGEEPARRRSGRPPAGAVAAACRPASGRRRPPARGISGRRGGFTWSRRRLRPGDCERRSPVDLDGFEAATVPHMNALYDAALRLAGDQATAQDLTQETYLRALRSFATFEPGSNAGPGCCASSTTCSAPSTGAGGGCARLAGRGRGRPGARPAQLRARPRGADRPGAGPGGRPAGDRPASRGLPHGRDAGRHQRPDLRRGGHRDGGAPRHHPVPAAPGPAPPRGAAAARAWKGAGR